MSHIFLILKKQTNKGGFWKDWNRRLGFCSRLHLTTVLNEDSCYLPAALCMTGLTGAFRLPPWFWNHNLTWLIPTNLWVTFRVVDSQAPSSQTALSLLLSDFADTRTQASRPCYPQTPAPDITNSFPSGFCGWSDSVPSLVSSSFSRFYSL